jgi:hypothetical protein
MLATLTVTFTNGAESSTVLAPADQQRVAVALEEDAQVMSNTMLTEPLAEEPPAVQEEILQINTDARPPALQVGPAGPAPRRAARAAQLVPDGAPEGPRALWCGRHGARRLGGRPLRSEGGQFLWAVVPAVGMLLVWELGRLVVRSASAP